MAAGWRCGCACGMLRGSGLSNRSKKEPKQITDGSKDLVLAVVSLMKDPWLKSQ